jgi:hypothetical protein
VKVGDLVIMPGETLMAGDNMSIGIIVEETDPRLHNGSKRRKRVGVMWVDGGGVVDFEPKAWLEVINESR